MEPTPITDEKDLLLRLRDGDGAAFTALYNHYHRPLIAHLVRMLKSTELAQEVVQDTFMALWENRDGLHTDSPLKPYLYTIAANHAYGIFRRAAVDEKVRAHLLPAIEGGYDHIESQLLKKDNERILQEILQEMPERQREIYVRCKLDGKTYAEVGQEFNVSTGTVHTHVKRANKFLKERLLNHPEFAGYLIIGIALGDTLTT